MNHREDMEKVLRSFEHEGAPGLKRSVMAAYEASVDRKRPFFSRRVPLYAAVTAVLVAVAISLVVAHLVTSVTQGNHGKSVQELTWSAAEDDLL